MYEFQTEPQKKRKKEREEFMDIVCLKLESEQLFMDNKRQSNWRRNCRTIHVIEGNYDHALAPTPTSALGTGTGTCTAIHIDYEDHKPWVVINFSGRGNWTPKALAIERSTFRSLPLQLVSATERKPQSCDYYFLYFVEGPSTNSAENCFEGATTTITMWWLNSWF